MLSALAKLKESVIAMSEMCEYSVTTAMTGLLDNDPEIVASVKDYDDEIDEMELTVDRQCRDLLLGERLDPVAVNFVLSAHKTNNDLERIGDNAVVIAEHALFLMKGKSILNRLVDFNALLEQVGQMLRESVTALVNSDVKLAWKIADEQKITDDFMTHIMNAAAEGCHKHPEIADRVLHTLFIAHALKRIADLAVNIAEEVIFIAENQTIRHHLEEYHPTAAPSDLEKLAAMESAMFPSRKIEITPADTARSDRWIALGARVRRKK